MRRGRNAGVLDAMRGFRGDAFFLGGVLNVTQGFKARRGTPRRYKDRGVDH